MIEAAPVHYPPAPIIREAVRRYVTVGDGLRCWVLIVNGKTARPDVLRDPGRPPRGEGAVREAKKQIQAIRHGIGEIDLPLRQLELHVERLEAHTQQLEAATREVLVAWGNDYSARALEPEMARLAAVLAARQPSS